MRAAIFRAIECMRTIADEAVIASKSARRQRERRLRLIQGGRSDTAQAADRSAAEASIVDDNEDQDTRQPWERMLPVEEWRERATTRTCVLQTTAAGR